MGYSLTDLGISGKKKKQRRNRVDTTYQPCEVASDILINSLQFSHLMLWQFVLSFHMVLLCIDRRSISSSDSTLTSTKHYSS